MRRTAVVLTALVLVIAACSDDDDADPTTTTEVTTTAVDTTATEPSTTSTPATTSSTTTSSTAPPTSANPGTTSSVATTAPSTTDWAAVVQTLGQRRQDLYASPDVARIPEISADDSQCAQQLEVQIGDLGRKGWRVAGADPFVVLNGRLEDFEGDSLDTALVVTVVAVIQRQQNAGSIVDSSGATVAAVEVKTSPGFNARGRFLLGRVGPTNDPWRIISQDELPEVPA